MQQMMLLNVTFGVIWATLPQNPDVKIVLGDISLAVKTCPKVPINLVCSDWALTAPLDITFWEREVFCAEIVDKKYRSRSKIPFFIIILIILFIYIYQYTDLDYEIMWFVF